MPASSISNLGPVLALALAICGVAPLRAQEPAPSEPDILRNLSANPWELSSADRSKTCILKFRRDAAPQGFALDKDANCAALEFTKGIVAWRMRGLDLLALVDEQGRSVIDLSEVESGTFEGQRPGEGIFLLQNAEEAKEATRSMDLLVGNWALVRPQGQSVCRLTLTNTPAAQDNFQIFTKAPCESFVTSFAPINWRLERGAILINSLSGEVWRFEADDLAQWRRVPENIDPLLLQRQ